MLCFGQCSVVSVGLEGDECCSYGNVCVEIRITNHDNGDILVSTNEMNTGYLH
jgi:hypothetical protein